MHKDGKSVPASELEKTLLRRDALKGLGAVVLIGCGGTENGPGSGGALTTSGGASSGGALGSGGAASGGTTATSLGGATTLGGTTSSGGTTAASGGTTVTSSGGATVTGGAPASGGTTAASGGTTAAGGTTASGGMLGTGGSGGGIIVPPWDAVPMCKVNSATDGAGQGPFHIHETEKSDDVSMIRRDIRGRYNESAAPGVDMNLHLRILSSKSSDCGAPTAVPKGTEIYIWHTDAQGFYSGFGKRGGSNEQKPDQRYSGMPGAGDLQDPARFCRGIQTTDDSGVVSFQSIFPGWYNGRVLHIHFVAFLPGSSPLTNRTGPAYGKNNTPQWLFTTQFYFEEALADAVYKSSEPYIARRSLADYGRSIKSGKSGTEPSSSGLIIKASQDSSSKVVTAQMQVLLNPS